MTTATAATVKSVKVDKKFSVPGIAFCSAAEAPDSLYFGSSDFKVYRVDPSSEKPHPTPISAAGHRSYVTGLVRQESNLVSAGYDGSLIWWDAASGDVRHRVDQAHEKWIRQLAVSPDGSSIASVGDDMKTRLWNSETADLTATWSDYDAKTPHGYPSMLYAVAFSPDGRWLATGNRTGKVIVRNVANGNVEATLEAPVMYTWDPKARRHSIGGIRSVAFSNDSKLLAVGGIGKIGNIDHLAGNSRIEIFDWKSGERRHEIEDGKYKGLVERMHFGPDDAWLAAGGGDHGGFLSVYGVGDGKLMAQEKTPMHVHDFILSDDGREVWAVGHEQACVVTLGLV